MLKTSPVPNLVRAAFSSGYLGSDFNVNEPILVQRLQALNKFLRDGDSTGHRGARFHAKGVNGLLVEVDEDHIRLGRLLAVDARAFVNGVGIEQGDV